MNTPFLDLSTTFDTLINDEAIKNDPELDNNFNGVLCTHYGKLN